MNSGPIAFAIAVAGFSYGARRIARILTLELSLGPFAPGALTAGLGVGLYLFAVAFAGRVAGSFDAGLWTGAGAGVLLAGASRLLPMPQGQLPRASRRTELWVLFIAVASVLLYYDLAFTYQMHDEFALFGHKSMVEQLRRGTYPVYFPPMPQFEARYHYGFDVLAGVLTRSFGASSDLAIDLVTILLVLFMAQAAAAVACDTGAERSAPLAIAAIHLGGGLAAIMLAGDPAMHPRCFAQYHHPTCGVQLYPTQLLNIFQHPVSLGVPMFLVMLLLAPRIAGWHDQDREIWRRPAWWILLLLAPPFLAAFALGHVVYYGLASLAAVSAVPFWLMRREQKMPVVIGPLVLFVVLGLGFLLARSLGGMLAEHPYVDTTLFAPREVLGFPKDHAPLQIVENYLVNLGLGFALFPVIAILALKERRPPVLMLLAFAFGGMLAPQLYDYARSWDIVKFPSAASYALAVLYVVVIDRALAARPFPVTWVRRLGAALLMATGITTAVFLVFPLQRPGTKLYSDTKVDADPLVRKTIDWWLAHGYQDEEVIYAQRNVAKELSVFGGLSTVGFDSDFYFLGIDLKKLYRLRALGHRVKHRMDRAALEELGIRWVMFSDEEVNNLGKPAQDALDDAGRFQLMHTIEDPRPGKRRRIWRVRTSTTGR